MDGKEDSKEPSSQVAEPAQDEGVVDQSTTADQDSKADDTKKATEETQSSLSKETEAMSSETAQPQQQQSDAAQPTTTTQPSVAPSTSKQDPVASSSSMAGEKIEFKVVYNKKKYDIAFGSEETVGALKAHLQDVIGVPSTMQKVMIKGLAKDEMTLKKLGVTKGSKIMVVGSTLNDVLEVTKKPTPSQLKEEEVKETQKESLCQQKQHKKVLEKGPPDDVMPGIKNVKEVLPPCPISGMLNKSGGKVRLTFKLELDQVWIGTKERTQKLPLNSVKTVVSEVIEGHEEYSMLALQLGPTEASRYWIYWVPNQYVEAIKEAILGKWQLF
jgi:hypothetical protein